ncbi:MAG: hypothetical protein KAR40_10870 [Candidatus Sabulitectum sp.]|nr:hypothetical protein [Candidatus Sabulitectum sp.]
MSNEFALRSLRVLNALKNATIAVVSSLPQDPRTGTQISKALGLDKTLTWKIVKFIDGKDIYSSTKYIPGASSYGSFLRAAEKKGASRRGAADADIAYQAFLQLIKRYTGDRASLDLMLLGVSEAGRKKSMYEQKKTCFRAQRFINGASASVSFLASILPEPTDMTTIFAIRGYTNLLRYRPNAIPLYDLPRITESDLALTNNALQFSPIFQESIPFDGGIPYYTKYCTCNMPQNQTDTVLIDDIMPESNDDSFSSVDLVTAQRVRTMGLLEKRKSKGEKTYQVHLTYGISFPSEIAYMDVFVHKSIRLGSPKCRVCNELAGSQSNKHHHARADAERFRYDEEVTNMGLGVFCSQIREIPWYTEMLSETFQFLQLKEEEFEMHRVCVEYPYLPSSIGLIWE